MQKFAFSMEKILDLRRFEQKQAEIELGKANAEIARIQRELDAVASQVVSVTKQCDDSAEFMLHYTAQNYFIFLGGKKEKFLNEMAMAQQVADEKREAVRLAMQKVKALEKLREKKFAQWKKAYEKHEEEVADDTAISLASQE